MPGARMMCGALNSWFRSSPIIEPHSARDTSPVTPMNASAAISSTAAPIPSVPATTIGVIELGMIRADQDAPGRLAEGPRRGDVVVLLGRQHRGPRDPGIDRYRDDADGQQGVEQARSRRGHDGDREEQRGEGEDHVHEAHERVVRPSRDMYPARAPIVVPTRIAKPIAASPTIERRARPVHDPAEDVAEVAVGPEQVLRLVGRDSRAGGCTARRAA